MFTYIMALGHIYTNTIGGPLKCSIQGPFNLESLEAKTMMMVDKEAHGMKAFLGLGPIVIF